MPSSFSSQTFSSSSSSINGRTTSRTQSTYSDASGTRVHQTTREPGRAPREERFELGSDGRRLADGNSGRITDVSDVEEKEEKEARERENDRLYEERIEEEYAKREGGA
ncbi:uncharacterized protein M421DRAFT_225556 [Didymella exigua CBS 183.55]|uniref:Uncharacterized protein n=1 Tax=Didymella exigua CBS 183.55 TaxID=1150837 RepID=A0A6A5RD18_9PLEO|nr:uncharacterized protein M421DRAFT_225556 [Didymella exigua CBS 183.55]KAF1926141.1 hypothetical protein M421DRAFT_225556 [Didymella exigua CBS 183.55]